MTRALADASKKLAAAGINVVDWEPYKHDHGVGIIVRIVSYRIPRALSVKLTKGNQKVNPLLPRRSSNLPVSPGTNLRTHPSVNRMGVFVRKARTTQYPRQLGPEQGPRHLSRRVPCIAEGPRRGLPADPRVSRCCGRAGRVALSRVHVCVEHPRSAGCCVPNRDKS